MQQRLKTWFAELRKTLYFRISLTFLALTVFSAFFNALLFLSLWKQLGLTADQWLEWEVAEHLAQDVQPLLQATPNEDQLHSLLQHFVDLKPGAEVYILDSEGKSVYPSYWFEQRRVDLGPLEEFLTHQGLPRKPIWNRSPNDNDRDPVTFSVARVELNGEPGYLYVIFPSKYRQRITKFLGDGMGVVVGIIVFALTTLFTAVVGLFFFFQMTKRFRSMTDVLRKFAQGSYSMRIAEIEDDELGVQAKAFNSMADMISANILALERTDADRRELVANISHDLRLPMAVIQSKLETLQLKRGVLSLTEQDRYIVDVLSTCDQLNRLLNELFELSKMNSKGFVPEVELLALDELIQDVVIKFSTLAREKQVKVELLLPERMPFVMADTALINRAFRNLIDNAIRYTPAGGCIKVSATVIDSRISVEVSDSGIGISEDDLPHVFERFYRATSAKQQKLKGTGLGLAITKKIFDIHQQELSVLSKLDQGTTFRFTLAIAENS